MGCVNGSEQTVEIHHPHINRVKTYHKAVFADHEVGTPIEHQQEVLTHLQVDSE